MHPSKCLCHSIALPVFSTTHRGASFPKTIHRNDGFTAVQKFARLPCFIPATWTRNDSPLARFYSKSSCALPADENKNNLPDRMNTTKISAFKGAGRYLFSVSFRFCAAVGVSRYDGMFYPQEPRRAPTICKPEGYREFVYGNIMAIEPSGTNTVADTTSISPIAPFNENASASNWHPNSVMALR